MMSLEHICYLAVFTHLSKGYLLVCLHTSLYKKKMCFSFYFIFWNYLQFSLQIKTNFHKKVIKQNECIFRNFHITKMYFSKMTTQHFVNSPVVTLTLEIIETIYDYSTGLFIYLWLTVKCVMSDWVSNCCLMPNEQFFSYLMARISYI